MFNFISNWHFFPPNCGILNTQLCRMRFPDALYLFHTENFIFLCIMVLTIVLVGSSLRNIYVKKVFVIIGHIYLCFQNSTFYLFLFFFLPTPKTLTTNMITSFIEFWNHKYKWSNFVHFQYYFEYFESLTFQNHFCSSYENHVGIILNNGETEILTILNLLIQKHNIFFLLIPILTWLFLYMFYRLAHFFNFIPISCFSASLNCSF